MAYMIEPKVNIVSYGPEFRFPNGQIMTADEFVYAAANITYKNIGALSEFMELREDDTGLAGKVQNALIKVAGAGHASMATTPGLWIFLEGNCSKLVDSIFTGARFGSSLMPSGRRVPITVDQIVIPPGIREKGEEAERLYLMTSERNIHLYEELQGMGIPKQDASKIVQYGHRGGGFMFMPLETLIYFAKLAEQNPDAMPREGIEIINQMEQQMERVGMKNTYFARKSAPRASGVNPEMFHFRRNFAQEKTEENFEELKDGPKLLSLTDLPTEERSRRIQKYLTAREEAFKDPSAIEANWPTLLTELDKIVTDFNDSVSAKIVSLVPWRVWGEIKRHRTLPQTVESVYNAADRALDVITNGGDLELAVSMPGPIKQNSEAREMWEEAFRASMYTYEDLISMGVNESDAIQVVPRGLKLGVVRTLDLFNMTTGYLSLRLCKTAEPEMRENTEKDRRLLQKSELSADVKKLFTVKCSHTGFCPEVELCERIHQFVPFYDPEIHKLLETSRKAKIRESLESL